MKNLFLLLPMMFLGVFCMADCPAVLPSTCPSPTNVAVTAKSSGSISFDWDNIDAVNGYEIWYVRQSDGYTSSVSSASFSAFSYAGLQAGEYDFHFVSVCGGGRSAEIIVNDFITN